MDPKELKFTRTHEWCLQEDKVLTVGITDYAAKNMGDIIFVEMPDPEDDVLTDVPCGEIETVTKDIPIHSPADGRAIEVNARLIDDPEPLRKDPYGEGWIVKIAASDTSTLQDLLTYEQYSDLTK